MDQKMVGLRIGDKSKPEILLQGGQHAREWIAPGALAYAADKLLEKDSTGVLKDFSVMIIPAANPDGYDYSRKSQNTRMWRKNLEDFPPQKYAMLMESADDDDESEGCYGTDLNRNWAQGSQFHKVVAGEEVSNSECSNTFQGSKPMSEKEVQNLANYVQGRKSSGGNIAAFVDVHSYSQKVIPAGCDNQKMSQQARQRHLHVTTNVAKAMSEVAGKSYTSGECSSIMYACSGVAHDWAHFDARIPVSMAIELRDQGQYGFLVPPRMIKDTGKEMLAGVQALAKAHKETELLVDSDWAEGTL
jgi:murein tripeptide amidase MpaA